jgi:uncharacterized repeat protein (TIGR03803 family)
MSKTRFSLAVAFLILSCFQSPAPGQSISTLWTFTGGTDGGGSEPGGARAGLVQALDGNFYGTTYGGGTNGLGTVFRVSPTGAFSNLWSFTASQGVTRPYAGTLVQASDGNLYGLTTGGGYGTIYRITTNGAVTLLHAFRGQAADGASPYSGLIQANDGNLYGATAAGGVTGCGTIFSISPTGDYRTVWSFSCGFDGRTPYSPLFQGSDGALYGTTRDGGVGTLFRMNADGNLTTIWEFKGGAAGALPFAGVVQDEAGNLYGTTVSGGIANNGTIFKFSRDQKFSILHSFSSGDGAHPYAGLTRASDGNFYGTTYEGGLGGFGTIFRITPSGNFTNLWSFVNGLNGYGPYSGIVQGEDGSLYGTTLSGGAKGFGTVFRFSVPSLSFVPSVTVQPESRSAFLGSDVTLRVVAKGTLPLVYAWRSNSVTIPNATNSLLLLTNFQPSFEANYDVVITNFMGKVTSSRASLYSNSSLRFTGTKTSSNGLLSTVLIGRASTKHVILTSTNLAPTNWIEVSTANSPSGVMLYNGADLPPSKQRYFRARTQPN